MTFRGNSRSASAFTLAELLIVVGIIAILAAIAVSNYALVSVRSKVARVHSELRTLAGAIEMYNVDHDRQPRMADFVFYGDVAFDTIDGVVVRGVMSKALSTPIAYATNAHVRDPLMDGNSAANLDEQIYTYHDLDSYIHHEPNSSFWPRAKDFYGEWRLISVGDRKSVV